MKNSLKIGVFSLSIAMAGVFSGCAFFTSSSGAYCDNNRLTSKETQARYQTYKDEAQKLKDDKLYNEVLELEKEWNSTFNNSHKVDYSDSLAQKSRCLSDVQAYKEIMDEVGTKDIDKAKDIRGKLKAEVELRKKIADRGNIIDDKRKQNKGLFKK